MGELGFERAAEATEAEPGSRAGWPVAGPRPGLGLGNREEWIPGSKRGGGGRRGSSDSGCSCRFDLISRERFASKGKEGRGRGEGGSNASREARRKRTLVATRNAQLLPFFITKPFPFLEFVTDLLLKMHVFLPFQNKELGMFSSKMYFFMLEI